jgi:hypothetical protein
MFHVHCLRPLIVTTMLDPEKMGRPIWRARKAALICCASCEIDNEIDNEKDYRFSSKDELPLSPSSSLRFHARVNAGFQDERG